MKNTNYPRKAISLLLAMIMLFGAMPLNIIALDDDASVTIQYNGADASSVNLIEDDKLSLDANTNLSGDLTYQWEILVDGDDDIWVKIADKTRKSCEVTYALIKSCLDDDGCAYLRVAVSNGDKNAVSEPVKVIISYLAPVANAKTVNTSVEREEYDLLGGVLDLVSMPVAAAEGDSISVIDVYFEFKTQSGRLIKTLHYPLAEDFEPFDVVFPVEIGYLPTYKDQQINSIEVSKDSLPERIDGKYTYEIIYVPQEVEYKVYHYLQNVNDDGYTVLEEPTIVYGLVEDQVSDTLHKIIEEAEKDGHKLYEGYEHIYYARPEIAPDGSTTVEIYYNRVYHSVLFQVGSEYTGAYGQENLYVKYGTTVGVNNLKCEGYVFNKWQLVEANGTAVSEDQTILDINNKLLSYINSTATTEERQITITQDLVYQAIFGIGDTTYKILFWRENANNGLYSLWHSDVRSAQTGQELTWSDDYLAILEEYDEGVQKDADGNVLLDNQGDPISNGNSNPNQLQFFTLDWDKTQGDFGTTKKVKNDGSTVINIYYARRIYTIDFYADTSYIADGSTTFKCGLAEHKHGEGFCKYNPYRCEHPEHVEHSHTDACGGLVCEIPDEKLHMHDPELCCDTHVHQLTCYSTTATTFESGLRSTVTDVLQDRLGWFFGSIADWLFGDGLTNEQAEISQDLATMAPPQNLQNGYVCNMNNTISVLGKDYVYPVNVIYIDGDWYWYEGDLTQGEVQVSDCEYPDHDHTSGCTYGDTCADCKSGSCSIVHKCDLEEHVHYEKCFESCNVPCHTAECYGYLCMIPAHNHESDDYLDDTDNAKEVDANGNLKGEDDFTTDGVIDEYDYTHVATIQAKYGQDIMEFLPYYTELSESKIETNGKGHNFTAWQYAGTGWNDQRVTRYVKHVTMVSDLCYSQGTQAFAVYDENANTRYQLHYMFENLEGDSSDTKYIEDPKHSQIVYWNGTDLAPMGANNKNIAGFKAVSEELLDGSVDYYIFYDRIKYTFTVYNQGNPIKEYEDIKHGQSFGSIAQLLLNDGIDVNDMLYPSDLEPGAYKFNGWYSTDVKHDYSKVDWESDEITEDNLSVFAIWDPVVRVVEVYHDVTLNTQFATDGYQEVEHRGFANNPSLDEVDLDINNDGTDDLYFAGWFYFDEEKGEETAFLFDFPIKQDMKIYAKWSSNTVVSYQIRYVIKQEDANGVEIKTDIAAPTNGIGVLGHNKTFLPKSGTELYEEYQDGYYPTGSSHTVRMGYDLQGNYLDVVTYEFEYEKVESVKYRVEYRESGSGIELKSAQILTTKDPGAWAMFIPIEGYTVDKLSKSIILSSNEEENVIIFYYTKNEVEEGETVIPQAPWVINHYLADYPYGTYSLGLEGETVLSDISHEANGFVKYGGAPLDNIAGYAFEKATVTYRVLENDVLQEKTVDLTDADIVNGEYVYNLTEYGMFINFYYKRVPVGYTILYVDEFGNTFTENPNFEQIITADQSQYVHGHTLTISVDPTLDAQLRAEGYGLTTSNQVSLALDVNANRNVFKFQYAQRPVFFYYNIVGVDNLAEAGVSLSLPSETIDAGSDEQTKGSTAYESEKYFFKGWYSDEACTQLVTENAYIQPQPVNGLYEDATYYALFLPRNADTTISVESEFDGDFILHIVGSEGLALGTNVDIALQNGDSKIVNLPVGKYTVVVDSDWSWRYGVEQVGEEAVGITLQIEVVVSGDNEFALVINEDTYGAYVENYKNSQWLDANGYSEYTPD